MQTMKYKTEVFEPKKASKELWESFHIFRENAFREIFPDDPLHPRERIVKMLTDPNPNYDVYHYLILKFSIYH